MGIRDNAPIGITCPTIDEIIKLVEKVRSDNGDLRDWGNDLCEKIEELESTIEKLEIEIEDLKIDLTEAQKK